MNSQGRLLILDHYPNLNENTIKLEGPLIYDLFPEEIHFEIKIMDSNKVLKTNKDIIENLTEKDINFT